MGFEFNIGQFEPSLFYSLQNREMSINSLPPSFVLLDLLLPSQTEVISLLQTTTVHQRHQYKHR